MQRTHVLKISFICFICFLSQYASAVDCRNLWVKPSTQTMSLDSSISFELTDYRNGERHFSMKQGPDNSVDIYYLRGALLVKGYTQDQIEKLSDNAIFMMPMAFVVPTMVLSEIAPKGPCTIEKNASFSLPLSGAMRLQGLKLTNAAGEILPSAASEVTYQLDISTESSTPEKASVRYSGKMSFAPQLESPSDEIDVSGYILVTRLRSFSVAGSSGIPGKLGELKRVLATR